MRFRKFKKQTILKNNEYEKHLNYESLNSIFISFSAVQARQRSIYIKKNFCDNDTQET